MSYSFGRAGSSGRFGAMVWFGLGWPREVRALAASRRRPLLSPTTTINCVEASANQQAGEKRAPKHHNDNSPAPGVSVASRSRRGLLLWGVMRAPPVARLLLSLLLPLLLPLSLLRAQVATRRPAHLASRRGREAPPLVTCDASESRDCSRRAELLVEQGNWSARVGRLV